MKKNILLSVSSQMISMLVSLIAGMVVPKFIDEYQYAYWQTYVLYVSYVGVLHFGLLDGVILRYSRYDYDELDKRMIRSQFRAELLLTGTISVLTMAVLWFFAEGTYRTIFLLVAVGIVTKNLMTYTSYTFQITNRIGKYAGITVSCRLIYGGLLVLLLLGGVKNYVYYAAADLCADVLAVLIYLWGNREMYFGPAWPWKKGFAEAKTNVSAGILLMLANFSYMLLFGCAKMVTEWHWDELLFGKVSFAFSLSNLFLTLISGISVVLFPAIKRLDPSQLPSMYRKIRRLISSLLVAALLLYYPGCVLVRLWLPKYEVSLDYLAILLPAVVYSSKVSMLTNNYLKAYMRQKKMCVINMISLAVSMGMFLVCAYALDDLRLLLISVVLGMMLLSLWSEKEVLSLIGQNMRREQIAEFAMSVIFILCAVCCSLTLGFVLYLAAVLLYLLWSRKQKKRAAES